MKKAYLIHGWGGDSKNHWFPWLSKELTKKGFHVKSFDMPDTENPKIEKWVKHMEKNISSDELDENTYFVGHSIGCQTIMRYLEKLPKQKQIGGCVFVAPWLNLNNLEPEDTAIAHPWINTKIDFERIKRHTSNILCLFSDNDTYDNLSDSEIFKDKLGAKIILKHNHGHFTSDDGVEKIPEILDFIK